MTPGNSHQGWAEPQAPRNVRNSATKPAVAGSPSDERPAMVKAVAMPGIATAFTIGGLSSLGLPATAGFVAEFLTFLGAWSSNYSWWLFPAVIGAFLTSLYVLRVTRQIFWGPKSADPHFQDLPDARGPEWAALGILVFVLILFGVAPSIAIGPVDTATVPLLQRLTGESESAANLP